jgi:hypothetical protein
MKMQGDVERSVRLNEEWAIRFGAGRISKLVPRLALSRLMSGARVRLVGAGALKTSTTVPRSAGKAVAPTDTRFRLQVTDLSKGHYG